MFGIITFLLSRLPFLPKNLQSDHILLHAVLLRTTSSVFIFLIKC